MPEINQYNYNLNELLELIIKNSDIHEGKWTLQLNFAMAPGNFATDPSSPSTIMPGMVVGVQGVILLRDNPLIPAPEGVAVDAAKLNPKKPK